MTSIGACGVSVARRGTQRRPLPARPPTGARSNAKDGAVQDHQVVDRSTGAVAHLVPSVTRFADSCAAKV